MASKIILSRNNEFLNRTRAYRVFIDGEEVGKIGNATTEEFQLAEGKHTIKCKIDWCSSGEHTIETNGNDNIYLQVKSGMKYFMTLYIIMMVWLASGLVFKSKKAFFGAAYPWIQWVVVLVPLLYMVYYFTIGKNKYLEIGVDKDTVFTK
jgi:uncharacterized membrane protein YhdT